MALAQLSETFTSIKGKVRGTIFQDYRGTTMIKARVSGGGRRSTNWDATRARLATVSSQWKDLTPAQQDSFNSAAPSFPYIDKFGNPQTPSGYQLFCTLNVNRLLFGGSILTTAPSPGTQIGLSAFSLAITDPDTYNLTWSAPVVSGYSLGIYASPQISTGLSQPPSRWRQINRFAAITSQPVNLQPQWEAEFGYKPTAGRIWIKVDAIIAATGEGYGDTVFNDDI